ncbi:hypothetical protein ACHAWF_002481 [Thalassiosira exigua]
MFAALLEIIDASVKERWCLSCAQSYVWPLYGRYHSYRTGVMTCRTNVKGVTIGETLRRIKVKNFKLDKEGEPIDAQSKELDTLVKAVSMTCRSLGYTREAAKQARMLSFAMLEHFGINGLFLTITPCDECSFRFDLPDLTDEDELLFDDLEFRKKMRLRYAGACSLEFQSVIHIVTEELLQWDIKKQKAKGPGVLGTVFAFVAAVEEQGQKTLHIHFQIWVKQITQKMRENLLHPNAKERKAAHDQLRSYIDKVMSAHYCDELVLTHRCDGLPKTVYELENEMDSGNFKEFPDQTLRNACSQTLCKNIKGLIMQCTHCKEYKTSVDIVNLSLRRWKMYALQGTRRQMSDRTDTALPLARERLDVATYTYHITWPGGPTK